MKIIRAFVLGTAFVLSITTSAATKPSRPIPIECGKTTGFQVESEIINQEITMLYVTFIGKKPSNKQAEKALRECLDVAVKKDATKDILPTAWFRKNPRANQYDDDQINPFGAWTYLSYTASTKKIEVKEIKLKGK
jgi:hypothetical protein